jgi:hypothetical protein
MRPIFVLGMGGMNVQMVTRSRGFGNKATKTFDLCVMRFAFSVLRSASRCICLQPSALSLLNQQLLTNPFTQHLCLSSPVTNGHAIVKGLN